MIKKMAPSVAVLVPCRDESETIAKVVNDFRMHLPQAQIHVFDNCSRDDTFARAKAAGAKVHRVGLPGKGSVIRRAFADIEADVYLMVDGDDTYDAGAAPALVRLMLTEELDMVVGARVEKGKGSRVENGGGEGEGEGEGDNGAYRPGHRLGNRLLTRALMVLFGSSFEDLLSGYRVFSRRFVKSFPAHSSGFEIETELAVHALKLQMPAAEMPTEYGARPEGSESKLRTYRDGWRILLTIVRLFKLERPMLFFFMGSALCWLIALALSPPVILTYLLTGLVPRLPTAILCSALVLLGAISALCGLVLDTVTHGRTEAKRLAYLAVPRFERDGEEEP